MEFRLSRHAEWEMGRRGIPLKLVRCVLDAPEQCLPEGAAGTCVYQPRLRFEDGKIFLLRVVPAEEHTPPLVVTAYRTSKIEKYWSAE